MIDAFLLEQSNISQPIMGSIDPVGWVCPKWKSLRYLCDLCVSAVF